MARLALPTPSESDRNSPAVAPIRPSLQQVLGDVSSPLTDDELLERCRRKLEELLPRTEQDHNAVSVLWDHLHTAGANDSLQDLYQRFTSALTSHLTQADTNTRGTAYTVVGRETLHTISRTWGVPARLVLKPSLIPSHLSRSLLIGLSALGKGLRCPLADARVLLEEQIDKRLTQRAGLRGVPSSKVLIARDVEEAKKVWLATHPRATSVNPDTEDATSHHNPALRGRPRKNLSKVKKREAAGVAEDTVEDRPTKTRRSRDHSVDSQTSQLEIGRHAPSHLSDDSSAIQTPDRRHSPQSLIKRGHADRQARSSVSSSVSNGAGGADFNVLIEPDSEHVDSVTARTNIWRLDQARQNTEQVQHQAHTGQQREENQEEGADSGHKHTEEYGEVEGAHVGREQSTDQRFSLPNTPTRDRHHISMILRRSVMLNPKLGSLEITKEAYDTLVPGSELNGSAIDACLCLLQPCDSTVQILAHEALDLSNPASCQRLTLHLNANTRQLILPLLHNKDTGAAHWSLAVFDLVECQAGRPLVLWYDSMVSRSHYSEAGLALRIFYKHLTAKNNRFPKANPLNVQEEYGHLQNNGHDCGIFVVMNAARLLYGTGREGVEGLQTISPRSWRACFMQAFGHSSSAKGGSPLAQSGSLDSTTTSEAAFLVGIAPGAGPLEKEVEILRHFWSKVWEAAQYSRREARLMTRWEAGQEGPLAKTLDNLSHDIEIYEDMLAAFEEHSEKMRVLSQRLKSAPPAPVAQDTAYVDRLEELKVRHRALRHVVVIDARIEASSHVLDILETPQSRSLSQPACE